MQKKTHPKFVVPNYGAKKRSRVQERWRKQRGIDNKKRVYLKESGASPSIGYKNAAGVRFARPDGRFEMLIHNEGELRIMIRSDPKKAVRFAHGLSRRKRLALQKIAAQHKLDVVNKMIA